MDGIMLRCEQHNFCLVTVQFEHVCMHPSLNVRKTFLNEWEGLCFHSIFLRLDWESIVIRCTAMLNSIVQVCMSSEHPVTEKTLCCLGHTKLVLEFAVDKSKGWKHSQLKQRKHKWHAAISQCPLTLLKNYTSAVLFTKSEVSFQLFWKRMQGMVQPLHQKQW